MSRVQPPGSPVPSAKPVAEKAPGGGHVFAVFGMKASIENGAFVKWLVNIVPVVEAEQAAGCDARVTSFWSKQWDAAPPRPIWNGCAGAAFARPLTPSQP